MAEPELSPRVAEQLEAFRARREHRRAAQAEFRRRRTHGLRRRYAQKLGLEQGGAPVSEENRGT